MSEDENPNISIETRQKGRNILELLGGKKKNLEKMIYDVIQEIEGGELVYLWVIYQVYGLLLSEAKSLVEVTQDAKERKIGWKSPTYDAVSARLQEHDDYIVRPFEVVEGVTECGKCGSRKTYSVQKQVRSSDEPMTTFSRCVECGNSWKID